MALDAASAQTHKGSTEYLDAIARRVPEVAILANIEVRVLCNLDSSDVGHAQWALLAKTIHDEYENFEGFVIVHGTDTLAFTACALAYFLPGLTKTIVLTGSQRPLSELRTDARANLIDAVELAASGIPEVLVCFDGLVHRGTRTTKYSNEHLRAFRSPNAQPLGAFGVHFRIRKRLARKPLPRLARSKPGLDIRVDTSVVTLDACPGAGLPSEVADALVSSSKGLVLKGFGSGNLPLEGGWLRLCEKAFASKKPVVMATQCLAGRVSLDAYENGRAFRDVGVVSGGDMTSEALTLKLMVWLGRGLPFDSRHEFFHTPLAMECDAGLETDVFEKETT
jgi:L-asparaginase